MPRPRFSNWVIGSGLTLAGGATALIPIDQVDTFYPQYCLQSSWTATASSTGYSLKIYRAYTINGSLVYTTDGDSVTISSQPTASQSTTQTVVNDFSVDPELYPRYIGFYITNLDATNTMTYSIVGDR